LNFNHLEQGGSSTNGFQQRKTANDGDAANGQVCISSIKIF
jgi:hypothetical protein